MDETLRSDLHEAKGHAKEAARATLMAMRTALDYAIERLGGDESPPPEGGTPDASAGAATESAATEPGVATATPPSDGRADGA